MRGTTIKIKMKLIKWIKIAGKIAGKITGKYKTGYSPYKVKILSNLEESEIGNLT